MSAVHGQLEIGHNDRAQGINQVILNNFSSKKILLVVLEVYPINIVIIVSP